MFNCNVGIILLIVLVVGLGLLVVQQVFVLKLLVNVLVIEVIILYLQLCELFDFNLVQFDGICLILGELKGYWILVFLGFIFCLDVCLIILVELVGVQNQWEVLFDSLCLCVLFILVDLDCDSVICFGEYVYGFYKDILVVIVDIFLFECFVILLGFVFQKVLGKYFDENVEDYIVEYLVSLVVFDLQGCFVGLVCFLFNVLVIVCDLYKLIEKIVL